jgi:hypothetical protein
LQRLSPCFDFDYPENAAPELYLAPVKDFVTKWKSQETSGCLVFETREDSSALVYDTRFNRRAARFELDPSEAAIYRYCDEIRRLPEIVAFAEGMSSCRPLSEGAVREVLQRFYDSYLIVKENDSYLNVAMMDHEQIPWLAVAVLTSKTN